MKKLSVLFLCLIVSFSLKGQETKGVVFDHGTLSEILLKAQKIKKGPKMVFVDCFTTWCGPCKYMSNTIFPMENVGKYINANFLCVKIDMEQPEGKEIAEKYKIRAYPTFLLLDVDGNEINRLLGSSEAEEFIERVKKAVDPGNSPKARKNIYDSNKTFENAISYLTALEETYMTDDLQKFTEEVLPTLPLEEKYSDKMWPYIALSLNDPKSSIIDLIMNEKLIADQYVGKERLDKVICKGAKKYIGYYLSERIQNPDNEKFVKCTQYLQLLANRDATAEYFVKVSKLYTENKIDEITSLLNVEDLMSLSAQDENIVEDMILSIKGLPMEKRLGYLKAKAEFYNKQCELAKASIERYSKNNN